MNRSHDRRDPKRASSGSPGRPPPQDAGGGKQHGEGNYKATRDYDRGVKEHLRTHDVEREARDAAPRSQEEARQMEQAEELGRKKAEGMRDPKDRMDGPAGARGPDSGDVK